MIALSLAALAADVEVEARTMYSAQRAGSFVEEENVFVVADDTLVTSGLRLRLATEDGHAGLEMAGTIDMLAAFEARRPQRWGGLRALFGFRGRAPLTTTWTLFHLGVAALDVRDIATNTTLPRNFGSVGVTIRQDRGSRMQEAEGMLYGSPRMWAGSLRTRVGWEIRDTGLYLAFGGGTSRISAFDPEDLVQVAYGVELSVIWRP